MLSVDKQKIIIESRSENEGLNQSQEEGEEGGLDNDRKSLSQAAGQDSISQNSASQMAAFDPVKVMVSSNKQEFSF